jgi:hypothetical protein
VGDRIQQVEGAAVRPEPRARATDH